MIQSQDWANRDNDIDKKRRKQAEFLVKGYVPASCLTHIIVYDAKSLSFVQELVEQHGLAIKVAKSTKHYY